LANIFLFKGNVKGKVVLVGGAMSFFFGDCGGVDGNGAAMEARFFFSAAMDALFFLTDLGRSLFIAERRTLEGMVCAFCLMRFARED
jgi:hypothetical protein